jgi:hypothetical protein
MRYFLLFSWMWALSSYAQDNSTNRIREVAELRESFLFNTAVYPNPSQGSITIEGPEGSEIDLIDESGRLMMTMKIGVESKLEVTGMSTGVYMLRFRSDEGALTRRLIVQ